MRVIDGDLLEQTEGVIAHQVNCRNVIGAGVSGAIIAKYPVVERDYHNTCQFWEPEELLGTWKAVEVSPVLTIVNLYTQMDYGNSRKDGVVYTCMPLLIENLHHVCKKYAKTTVYVPYKIGCDLAGGSWEELEKGCSDLENLVAVRLNK